MFVYMCSHMRVLVCALKDGGESVVFHSFCHDILLYYSAQGALHMWNGFSLISTAA